MTFKLDNGKFPKRDYNKVIRRGKNNIMNDDKPDIMTKKKALDIWEVVQDVNSLREPQLVIKGRKKNIFI